MTDLSLFIEENGVKIHKDMGIESIIKDINSTNNSQEAFYINNLGAIVDQVELWREHLPFVEIFYAVKCNSDPIVLKLLDKLGCNFDCASVNEITTILNITKDASRIIYANPCKPFHHLQYARTVDIDTVTFDCLNELYKMKLFHFNANLILRIQVDDSKSVCRFNCKFGCDIEDSKKLLLTAKSLDLTVIGVSFHVGSGCSDPNVFNSAITDARKVFEYGKEIGFNMSILDLGGGFQGSNNDLFIETAKIIKKSLNDNFSAWENLRVIAEPGRFIVTTSHTLVVNVIGKKERIVDDEREITYYLNDGVYGSFNCMVYDHNKPVIQPFNEVNEKTYKSILFGPTCDSFDKMTVEHIMLPELAIGEWCYVSNFGAYTTVAATDFNGIARPAMYYVMITKQV
jgi:ornithine decarboxylase